MTQTDSALDPALDADPPTAPAPDPHVAVGQLMDMADLLRPNAIRVAAALEIADHLDAGHGTPEELAVRTGARPDMVAKLLRYLVTQGLLTEDGGRYAVAEAGAPLRSDHPMSVRQYLSATGLFGRLELGLVGLLDTVRTGRRSYEAAFGRGYWEDVTSGADYRSALEREGAARIGWDADLVVHAYDWSAVSSVTDVGGNNGTLLIELLTTHPHLRGTVLDLANLAELAGERIHAAGLADRAGAVAASFFDPLPTGSQVYLISGILADWDDADAVRILSRCAQAAGPTGRVVLAEINLDAAAVSPAPAAMDLIISSTMPAPMRSVADLEALGEKAGLTVTWRGPSTAVRSVLEFTPVG